MELPARREVIIIPVIGCKREDKIGPFWEWDTGDQGTGQGLDWFKEWQNVILPRPADDMMYRGVETEKFLRRDRLVPICINRPVPAYLDHSMEIWHVVKIVHS